MTDPTILTLAASYVPVAYVVTKIAFQKFQAVSPDGRDLGTYQFQRYAAQRCQRDALGLGW